MKEPIFTLRVDLEAGKLQTNPYDYERIHIWCFNYDGKGCALATFNDATEFESIYGNDLNYILCGDPGRGDGIIWSYRCLP